MSTEKVSRHQRLGFRFERLPEGVLVIEVANGMGAAVSGLQSGDVILTANGESGEDLITVLQDRSLEYVHLEVQPCWSTGRKSLVVQRGIGSGNASPVVAPLLKLAATDNLPDAKDVFQTQSYKSEDVVTALRLVVRNYPQKYLLWLDTVREMVPLNTVVIEALMRGYNQLGQFRTTIETYDEWQSAIGWDVWTQHGSVYTHANLEIERELLQALMQSGQQERAIKRMRELQHWFVGTDLESIVGMAPNRDAQIIWSDKGAPFAGLSGVDTRGESWSIEDKPWTVLAFWATWCAPCKKELPELNAWQQSRSDVTVLAVNVDDNLDSNGVLNALHKFGADSLTGMQSTELTNLVGVEAIPTIVLLDTNGTERYRMIGYSPATMTEIEDRMTKMVPRVQIAQARNFDVDWHPKSTLKDVLYDGRCWWLLDDQKRKTVSSLTGWLQGTEQETKDAENLPISATADLLVRVNGVIGVRHNQGRIIRFITGDTVQMLSASEPIDTVYTSKGALWGWGESKLEVIQLEQELHDAHVQSNTPLQIPLQYLDALPLYSDDTLLEFVRTESISINILQRNIRAFSTKALLGYDTIDFAQTDGVFWFLRAHTRLPDAVSYSLIALDESDNLLGTMSIRTAQRPRLVSNYLLEDPLMKVNVSTEDGQSLWVVIPEQGLLHIQIPKIQSPHLDRRQ